MCDPYTLADGVDDAMRMSPDYLIIGEVRDGRAAMSLFRALMTGHCGACTFHADSPREAVRRLATVMGADAAVRPHEANQMIADAVDLLVQIGIRHEIRRVVVIANVAKELKNGDVWFEPIFRYDEASPAEDPRWEQVGELQTAPGGRVDHDWTDPHHRYSVHDLRCCSLFYPRQAQNWQAGRPVFGGRGSLAGNA